MAKAERVHGMGRPKVGWDFFGSELKRRRERVGLTQQQLGAKVFCSGSYIGQIENGIRKPQPELAQLLDEALETDGSFDRMCEELVNNSPYERYFADGPYLESRALTIRQYAPLYIPGLLQTADYARAVYLASVPYLTDAEIEARISQRLDRQPILDHPTEPLFWTVLDQSVIQRTAGNPSVMHRQLTHIVALTERRRIRVQVLPLDGSLPPLGGLTKLMTFADAPPVVYCEGARTGGLVDDPAEVHRFELIYGLLQAAALPQEASLDLIRSVAERYAHERP
ncbi:Scr1 family TA system antitoxin-like transcriptional regulator [Streptomyces gamaensis]|uniref:Scr1 family TA system antitoxin-like transcriptional regulator n=1 Tax=Streptomyces gamaensis TaxID=1763542 RepID=A0ABW0Z5F1_9ACTN